MCISDLKRKKKKVTHLGNWDCLSGKQYTKHVLEAVRTFVCSL